MINITITIITIILLTLMPFSSPYSLILLLHSWYASLPTHHHHHDHLTINITIISLYSLDELPGDECVHDHDHDEGDDQGEQGVDPVDNVHEVPVVHPQVTLRDGNTVL